MRRLFSSRRAPRFSRSFAAALAFASAPAPRYFNPRIPPRPRSPKKLLLIFPLILRFFLDIVDA
jgi:hypothetical protein